MKIKFKLRKLSPSREGVAGVVVGLLFIGLIFSGIAFVQAFYVPQWMEEKEAEHMDQVAIQFSQLKFAIDTQSVLEKTTTVISNPITLGSKEMPFLFSSRSYGTLEVDPDDCIFIITDGFLNTYRYTLGALSYKSENSYFIDQRYSYETGGIILSQNEGDIFLVDPTISVENEDELIFDLTRLIEKTGTISASGFGTYPIQTKFIESESLELNNIATIEVYNSHIDAWEKFFDRILSETNIKYDIFPIVDKNGIQIYFPPTPMLSAVSQADNARPELSMTVSQIEVQITPGWIK
jgi:hypothetical protein